MNTKKWLWFTVPIAILLAIATYPGVFVNGFYRDAPSFAAQAIGGDYASLMLVLPTLLISAFFAGRGSARALLVWLGALVYLVYTYIIAAFVIKFNPMFLGYVALLGFSLYALIGGLISVNKEGIKSAATTKTPVKPVSILLGLICLLFYFVWLSEVIPAILAGVIPQSVLDNGTSTNAVQVLDMAWILPAFAISAVTLWRKQSLGFTLAGILLSYTILLMASVLSMMAFMARGGQVLVVPQTALFILILLICLGFLIWYLKSLKPGRLF